MTDEPDTLLASLAERTGGLEPPPDFAARVLARVGATREREPWAARGVVLGLLAAAAALAIWVSASAQQEIDARALSGLELVELEQ
ncbi:MAG: hypothetical protein L6Q84_28335 [Polyangiaceae bacterium]|nr:hypothetical protein [Polyangiaceae bacterium]